MSSPESEALRYYSADLVTAISAADPLDLAMKLFSKNLVERATVEVICLPTNPQTTKSYIIVTAVNRKVEADPSLFHQFTELLQDEEVSILNSISRKLTEKHRSIPVKDLSPSSAPPHHTCSCQQLQSLLTHYADKLRAVYAESEIPKYSNPVCYKWAPSPSRKYIDLTTINKKTLTSKQADECKKASLYGYINKITEKGFVNTVKFEEILYAEPGEQFKCILVEGAPGIGKSTLAWQVCHRWGKGELFQQYSTVLLLPLRDQRLQGATCVEDLFISTDKKLQDRIHKEVIQENWDGKDTLIILEGLDELPNHLLSRPSIFTALLSGTELPQATILVTSRPSATEPLQRRWQQRISRHFEIHGFIDEDIIEFARSVLTESQFSGFKSYLSIHPHIKSMMYVPLHCVIAVTVYLQCQQSRMPPPRTLTGLYTCLTQTILIQYLSDHPQYEDSNHTLGIPFDIGIPSSVHDHFKKLCRIAFEHVIDQKLVFPDLPKELHDLGFTDAVPEFLLYQQSANYSYNFLHLSVQEFLAAYHVSLMSSSEQEELMKTISHESHLQNMLRFIAGITKFKGLNKIVVKQAIALYENTSELSGSIPKSTLELLYECQDVSILDTEYIYSVKLIDPSPHLCLALGYCIVNSSCRYKLELFLFYDDTQAEMFIQELRMSKSNRIHIESLFWEYRKETFPTCVHELIPTMNRLNTLPLNLKLLTMSVKFEMLFSTSSIYPIATGTISGTPQFIQHFLPQLPLQVIVCIESLIVETIGSPYSLPSCLPELIPQMERLSKLTLNNVLESSLTELILVPTLRKLRIRSDSGKFQLSFPTCNLLPTASVNGTPNLISILSQLPQETIAHLGSLIVVKGSPPCLSELIPKMQRLNTLILKNVHDISFVPSLSRIPTLKNLKIQSDFGNLEMLFPTDNSLSISGTAELIDMFLPQLPQETIAHLESLIVEGSPLCLPELIPKMQRLNTLTLENVHDISFVPALSRITTLRNLQIQSDLGNLKMLFPTVNPLSISGTAKLIDMFLPQLPQETVAHLGSLIVEGSSSCLPELIPKMQRLNTLTLKNVHDISFIPALFRIPTLQNLKIQSDFGNLEMLFPTDNSLSISDTAKLIDMFLPQLPQETIAHLKSLIVEGSPSCLPELIPKMQRLNTLTLKNVHDISFIPALFRIPTLRNLKIQSDFGNLEMLFPTDNSLSTSGTAEFIEMFLPRLPQETIAHLESLIVEGSPVCLPELIPKMQRLNTLTLKNVHDISFVPALSRIPTLRNLKIQSCFGNLEMLFPTDNPISISGTAEFIDMFLSQLPQETIAHIGSLIVEGSRTCLPELIPKMKRLKKLDMKLRYYRTIGENGALAMVKILKHNTTLEELHLTGESIDSDVVIVVTEALHHNTTLKKLNMSQSTVGEWGALAMAEMLKHNIILEELNLSDLKISSYGAVAVAEALHHNTTLRKLDMSENPVGRRGALAMAEALKHNTTLEELGLRNTIISSDGAVAMTEALYHNTTLRKLNMGCNPVGKRGVCAIAEMLKHNTTLEELHLAGRIDSDLVVTEVLYNNTALRKLGGNTTLEELCLSQAMISSDGAVTMAEALLHKTTLRKLDMSRNPVGERGALAMAEMLKHNITLEELNLSHSEISSDGTVAMAKALHHNKALKKLDMSFNTVGERGVLAMAEMLKHNTSLKEMNLRETFCGDSISRNSIKALVKSLAENQDLKKLMINSKYKGFVTSFSVYQDHKERVEFI